MSLNLSAEQDTRPGAIGGQELGRSGENGHAGGAEADPLVQLSSLLWRAQLHCVIGGVRLGLKATRRIGRSQVQILDRLAAPGDPSARGEEALRTVVDEVRGCLRRIAEDTSHEARRLGEELGKLDASARTLADPIGDSPQAYHRRWKVKP